MVADGHVTHTHGNTRPMNVFTQLRLITLNKNVMKELRQLCFICGWGGGREGGKGHDNGGV